MSAVFIVLLFFLPHASELVMSARTWNNIAAALTRFYEGAAMTGEIAKSPVAYRDIRAGTRLHRSTDFNGYAH